MTRLARDRGDLDLSFAHLGYLEFEQPPHEIGVSAAEHHAHTRADRAHFQDHCAQAFADVIDLVEQLFGARQKTLCPLQAHNDVRPLKPLDRPGHDGMNPIGKVLRDGIPLGLSDLLDHDLLGGLGCNPPQLRGVNLPVSVESADFARFPVYGHLELFGGAQVLAGRRQKRRLDALEHRLLLDILLSVERVHQS